jgi:hypothetical protein
MHVTAKGDIKADSLNVKKFVISLNLARCKLQRLAGILTAMQFRAHDMEATDVSAKCVARYFV